MSSLLHPDIERLFAQGLIGQPDPQAFTVKAARLGNLQITELFVGPGDPVKHWWDDYVETAHGRVGLRWYIPFHVHASALLIYVHGGGWVSGSIAAYDTLCRSIAARVEMPVLSIEYDRSPEARWPKALLQVTDVLAAAEMLCRTTGISVEKLAVLGDSAGGALLGGALHHAVEGQLRVPDAVVLLYPVLDASLDFDSYHRFATGFHLTTARMRWYWEQYVGAPFQQRIKDPHLSPLQSPHLHNFPPTMVISAECDPLHDEGQAFMRSLTRLGVLTKYVEVPGHIHGFMRFRRMLNDPQWGPDAVMERIKMFLHHVLLGVRI